MELRPYQAEAARSVIAEWSAGRRTLVHWATGLGKTVLFSYLSHGVLRRFPQSKILITAHRGELLESAERKARAFEPGASIGWIKAERREYGARYLLGSVQSLTKRRLAELPDVKVLVIDEAHRSGAETYRVLIDWAAERGAWVLGVTATPLRSDGQALVGPGQIFESIAHRMDIREGVEEGYLCPLKGAVVHTHVAADLRIRGGDFRAEDMAQALDTDERNEIVAEAWAERAADRRTLVFAINVAHAERLAESIKGLGYQAVAIHGDTPKDERARAVDDLARGRIHAVVNCNLLTEGFDLEGLDGHADPGPLDLLPGLGAIVLARPISSQALGLYAQCIGRGTRLAEGKSHCLIIDCQDNLKRHDIAKLSDVGAVSDPEPKADPAALASESEGRELTDEERAELEAQRAAERRRTYGLEFGVEEIEDILNRPVNGARAVGLDLRWRQLGGAWVQTLEDFRGTVIAYQFEGRERVALCSTDASGARFLRQIAEGDDRAEAVERAKVALWRLGCRYDGRAWWRRGRASKGQIGRLYGLAKGDTDKIRGWGAHPDQEPSAEWVAVVSGWLEARALWGLRR